MERTTSVIFIIGAPGAGKGTLCKNLARDFGLKHVSVGDVLRKAVLEPDVDNTILKYVQTSELLPTELLFSVLNPHLLSGKEGHAHIILLDGFPRQLDQARSFEEEIDTSGTTDTSYEKLLNILKTRHEWKP
ncbi:uridine kinase [Grosmannia clavigera kw1407]|uniref:Uridine kinase n=1 Tax=Grosmannia clavigera (strain kw1407 / UAMH 11150) TaxID=655863 RepID=F0XKM4_GROCL|nr:uridine kinase [Grosmannia clavigera kw1407]EFX01594.1 uridine kinase [Grosmannia clavigera kw1407]